MTFEHGADDLKDDGVDMTQGLSKTSWVYIPPEIPCPRCKRSGDSRYQHFAVYREIRDAPVFEGCKMCLIELLEEVRDREQLPNQERRVGQGGWRR